LITELTQSQKDKIVEWRDKGLAIGRDVAPVDKGTVERVFDSFYGLLKLEKPSFWWAQSPLSAQIIIKLIKSDAEANVGNNIETNIWNNIGANAWTNIRANIETNVGANIKDNIWDNIWANVGANIGDNVGANIRDNIGDNIGNNIRDNIGDNIWANIWDNIKTNIWANIRDNVGANIKDNIKTNIWANIRDNIGDNIGANIRDNIKTNIWANIKANIRDNIWANIENNIGANIKDNIRANIGANIGDNIGDNIGNNIRDNIGDSVIANIENSIKEATALACWGQHDIGWISYFSYYRDAGLLAMDENFSIIDMWLDLAKSAGWCYTFENLVVVCEKPTELHFNASGQLHKDGDMALKYSDGYGLYMLNGVAVPEWLAVQRDTEIDPSEIAKIKNVEVRREFIRKVGLERIKYKLGAKDIHTDTYVIDNKPLEYKLVEFVFGDVTARALEMQNPSLPDVTHVEFVPLACQTVEDAWRFRTGIENVDNLNGSDWFLHGDVVIKPKDKTAFKLLPKLIA